MSIMHHEIRKISDENNGQPIISQAVVHGNVAYFAGITPNPIVGDIKTQTAQRKSGDRVRLFTRRGFDWTPRYPRVVEAAAKLKTESLTIDGELVCVDGKGVADFAKLHSRRFDGDAFLYGFDLLELNGENWRTRPLVERKEKLETILRRIPAGIRYCEHDDGDGATLFHAACRMGLEGIVSKRADSRYRSGRCKTWVKSKNPKAPSVLRVRDGLEG